MRPQKKMQARLARRIKAFDNIKESGPANKPTSKKTANGHTYHRPGSLKK